jgi:hypothetical protein
MELQHQLTRSRSVLAGCAAAMILTLSGCADMLPSSETMEKWTPSNIWYRMSPDQLSRLNEGNGLPSDVYYSVSDYPERNSRTVTANDPSNTGSTVVGPIDSASAIARP